MTDYRKKVLDFLKESKICTRCMSRPATMGFFNCRTCLDKKNEYKILARLRAGKKVHKKPGRPSTTYERVMK